MNKGELEQAVSTTGAIELSFLERGLVILATIANVAPLMGFLGTVAGMILAFASIEASGDVDPATVAGGIKVALLTTAAGLTIAIPINIGYNYFVSRIDRLIVDMEECTQKVLNIAWEPRAGREPCGSCREAYYEAAGLEEHPGSGYGTSDLRGAPRSPGDSIDGGSRKQEVQGIRRDPILVDGGHRLPAPDLLPGHDHLPQGQGARDRAPGAGQGAGGLRRRTSSTSSSTPAGR